MAAHDQANPENRQVHFTLLENGLDSMAAGIQQIARGEDKRTLKHGFISVDAGIELILKERLRMDDWKFLFPNPERADERLFQSGDFHSIDVYTCFERLDEHTTAEVPAQMRDMAMAYHRRRNKMQHFQFAESKEAIESATAKLLAVVLDFIDSEFSDVELTAEEEALLTEVKDGLNGFKRYAQERLAYVQPRIDEWRREGYEVIECPKCLQETLKADPLVSCAFCGYSQDAKDAAELFIENVLGDTKFSAWEEGGRFPLYCCPECMSMALVNYDEWKFMCFGCGSRFDNGELEICDDCGEPCDAEERFAGKCRECWNAFIERDNT